MPSWTLSIKSIDGGVGGLVGAIPLPQFFEKKKLEGLTYWPFSKKLLAPSKKLCKPLPLFVFFCLKANLQSIFAIDIKSH